jgi:hypothetical protein
MPSQAVFALESMRFRWLVTQVHRLGPRVVGELLAEIGGEYLIRTAIETKLERYAALDPAVVRALGGDRFPKTPLHLVQKKRKR